MKNGSFIDKDYFEKLLEEIREIRLSERRFYHYLKLGKCFLYCIILLVIETFAIYKGETL